MRLLSVLLLATVWMAAQASGPSEGERMYRLGLLPDGRPMEGTVNGDMKVSGQAVTCASCHLRSGLGSMEGGIRTLPISASWLFRPLHRYFPTLTGTERDNLPLRFQAPPLRPAYTDASLARLLRTGLDPNGRRLNPVMPIYDLDERTAGLLVDYLKGLSAAASPGVGAESMALATVVAGDVPPEDEARMMASLEQGVAVHNRLGPGAQGIMGNALAMKEMNLGYRRWTLARWRLQGPPSTWRAQLEALDRAAPVFALVGGLAQGSWEPIHRFCEDRGIPCILPLTDLPSTAPGSFYTLYFSKGLWLEGAASARFLLKDPRAPRVRSAVQVAGKDEAARALAAGFRETWRSLGGGPLEEISLEKGEAPGPGLRSALQGMDRPALALWTGPEGFKALEDPAADSARPAAAVVSATLGGPDGAALLPPGARSVTFTAQPYPADPALAGDPRRIASRARTSVEILSRGLGRMERNFHRDYLLDLVGMLNDETRTDYGRLTFGPGQRFASKGCRVVAPAPESGAPAPAGDDWVIP